jgi:hypothetical protein
MAPTVDLESVRAAFYQGVEDARKGVGLLVSGFNDLVHAVNKHLWLLGAAGVLWIRHKLEQVRDAAQKLVEKARHMIDHSTPIVSLILTSFDWISQVQKPASDAAARIPVTTDNLVYWSGGAAQAYTNKTGPQKDAASDVVAKADFISTWLFSIAQTNVDYVVKMAEIVSLLANKITQAAVDAASVFGVIEAINAVAGAAGDIVERGLNTLFGIASRLVALLKNVRDASSSINNHEKLPGGAWPQAVAG